MAAAMAYYIAAKIVYAKPEIHIYEQYVHEKAPLSTSTSGEAATDVRPSFDDQVVKD